MADKPGAENGKMLEQLVAFVEETLAPSGMSVDSNVRMYDDDGAPLAEFDVVVKGKVGSATMTWLIECRDRPSQGPAPGQWIQTLKGRREQFQFDKVTAVSTTGFAKGAVEAAKTLGIELRSVTSLTPEAFGEWLQIDAIPLTTQMAILTNARLLVPDASAFEQLAKFKKESGLEEPILRSSLTGEPTTAAAAFLAIVKENNLFEGLKAGDKDRKVRVLARYPNDKDHFFVETRDGKIRIEHIAFEGVLRIKEEAILVRQKAEYKIDSTSEPVSQFVEFEPFEIGGVSSSIEMHRIPDSGTHILMRKRARSHD